MPNGDKAMRLDEGRTLYNDLAERIKNLPSVDDVVAVTDVEPTEEGVKIWLPETPPQAIQVPTYAEFQELETTVGGKVADVQVNGTSVVNDGVANIPVADANNLGVVMPNSSGGIDINPTTNKLRISTANNSQVRSGTDIYKPITPSIQHSAAFYGLAKAAGADMASSANAVGVYTPEAQSAIKSMIGVGEEAYFISKKSFTNPTTVNSNASSVINAALTAAKTAGKNYCVIPEGEYWLTETIYLQDGVILKGCGMDATTLKIADNCDIDAIRVAGPINNSGIMDLAIDGNRITNYSIFSNGHHGNAINVWLHYGRIERVRTNWVYKHSLLLNYDTGSGDDGLGFDSEHQNDMGNLNKVLWCDFRDSLLQGVMWGWRTMDSWMCYTNIGSHAANLYIEGGTSRFIGNHFDGDGDNGAGPEYNVYCGDGCKAMLFDGNIFENTQKQNIFFRQPSYSNQTMTITISNNIIRTCSKSQNEQYPNIYISGYSDSVKATEITITGNQILNPDTNANHGYAGIHLAYCDNCKIIGNTFFNVGDDEVVIDNTCSNIINDSKISELSTDVAHTEEIIKGMTPFHLGFENCDDYNRTYSNIKFSRVENLITVNGERSGSTYFSLVLNHPSLYYKTQAGADTSCRNINCIVRAGKKYLVRIVAVSGEIAASSSSNSEVSFYADLVSTEEVLNTVGLGSVTMPFTASGQVFSGVVEPTVDCYFGVRTYIRNNNFSNLVLAVDVQDVTGILDKTARDVQVDGTSVVNNGVANIPTADIGIPGVIMAADSYGLTMIKSGGDTGYLRTYYAVDANIKAAANSNPCCYRPIVPYNQHKAVFYGLSKVAGVDLANENVTLGTYPQSSKSAIQTMLGVEQGVTFVETVTGTTPTITGQPNVRYICGEVSLLTITPPSAGTITVIFESGSTPTVLTLPSTVKFPEWVDISTLEANTTYEIIITDGVYGGVMSWAD